MAGVETLNEARSKLAREASRLNARHARGKRLPALILMTDDARDVDWGTAARALPAGSAVVVRHREARARENLARRLRSICAARRVKLLIASDACLAQRVRADGVHVPEKEAARVAPLKARHPQWLITASAHGVKAVASARHADAVLIAPAFATASHPGREALGALRIAALAAEARVGTYALGGVDARSIGRLSAARLSGVALIGGWTVLFRN
jgi:thiamine-phosphate pyrophosphorylase